MPYSCVPFDLDWAKGDNCPDVHAIYRRPHRDRFRRLERAADGTPAWDLTGPLPLRQHATWMAKGYTFVTLASNDDLTDPGVMASLRRRGLQPSTFLNGPGRQCWDAELYLAEATIQAAQDIADLEALVKEFGPEAVVKIKRQTDPTFDLPDGLKGRKPKGVAA